MSRLTPSGVRVPGTGRRSTWLEARRGGIGGSDVGAVCGLNPYSTPLDVYLQKVTGEEIPETEAMRWGRLLEDNIALVFRCEHPQYRLRRYGLVRSLQVPHHLASVDRLVLRNEEPVGVLEIKTAGSRARSEWEPGGPGFGYAPVYYEAQLQWYLHVTGLPRGWLSCLIGGQELVTVEREADPDMLQHLREEVDRFWREHVIPEHPPPAGRRDLHQLHRIYPADDTLPPLDLPAEAQVYLNTLRVLKQEQAAAEKQVEACQLMLKQALGEHTVGLIAGQPAVTWKQVRGRVDTAALFEHIGQETVERFRKPPTRRLEIKYGD